jgi:hypothetical protein
MIHSVKINDNFPSGKRMINELRRHPKAVEFENSALSGNTPEGFKTSDEFWKNIDKKIDNLCKEHGLL